MKITTQNIEAYLLDYYANQLSLEDQQAVELFLTENPEWKDKTEDLIQLPVEYFVFPNKNRLKKEISENEKVPIEQDKKEYLLFLLTEGQLDLIQQKEIDEWCAIDPLFSNEVKFALKSRLIAEDDVFFPNKHQLKREDKLKKIIYSASAIAASVTLFIGLYTYQSSSVPEPVAQYKSTILIHSTKRENKENGIQRKKFDQSNPDGSQKTEIRMVNGSERFNQFHQTDSKKDGIRSLEMKPTERPGISVAYNVEDTIQSTTDVADNPQSIDSLILVPTSNKYEQIQRTDYSVGFRPNGKVNNWTTVSQKLASMTKNNLVFKGTNGRDFCIKIGKFSFSRNKYSSKSNLSMR